MPKRFIGILMLFTCIASGFAFAADAGEIDLGFRLEDVLDTSWYGVYINQNKSGWASFTSEIIDYEGRRAFVHSTHMHLIMTIMGNRQEIDVIERRVFYLTGGMVLSETFMSPSTAFRAVVEGDQMRLTTSMAGEKTERMMPAPDVTLEDYLAPHRLILSDPEAGDSITSRQFDASLARVLTAETTVTGKKPGIHKGAEAVIIELDTVIAELGTTAKGVATSTGDLIMMTMPVGRMAIDLRLETEELAKNQNFQAFEALDLSHVPFKGQMPDPRNTRRVSLKVTLKDEEFPRINDNRQQFRRIDDNVYELLLRRDIQPDVEMTIPVQDEALNEFTLPTDFYQSNHPEIIAAARRIVANEDDLLSAVRKLNTWVYQNVHKKGTAAFSNALDTLRTMEGDCTEHTALFIGLCRAVGVPARGVIGIIYAPEINGFGGHAWAEVYIGRWIAVDPSWGELPASPIRIKLSDSDDLLETIRVMRFINDIEIEVIRQPIR